MSDVFAPEKRAAVMRAVKASDTGPELKVRALLRALGHRYRLHARDLPGRPDIVFRGRRKVIFVHGCFWHGHDCARGARSPKANADYWAAKITRNRARDAANIAALQQAGWSSLVIWECALRAPDDVAAGLAAFLGSPATGARDAGSRAALDERSMLGQLPS